MVVTEVDENLYQLNDHYPYQLLTNLTPATPLVILFCWCIGHRIVLFVYKIFRRKTVKKLIDQNLGSFYTELKKHKKEAWIIEEVVTKKRNKIKMLD